MTVKYVVSIAGQLRYFDNERQPTEPLPRGVGGGAKADLTLLPPDQKPAAASEWDAALAEFSAEQREAAEISEAP
ncbi:hypothetical protein [Xylophilus sp. GOD-11R]|uniref:hypothetical protein n=1 Tax=Xylophilus sp. GOD-11R TaxID=3089814 RepID=UPI00298C2F24|nr:hypothetical protein [Xylophilus sp. GOD-11R]WPB57354.1 hypothetical protein R9X41_01495 [Xylophilus sp. GOD-11R]